MPTKIEEVLGLPSEHLEKLTEKELNELLSPLFPATRTPVAESPKKQAAVHDMLAQLTRMLNEQNKNKSVS